MTHNTRARVLRQTHLNEDADDERRVGHVAELLLCDVLAIMHKMHLCRGALPVDLVLGALVEPVAPVKVDLLQLEPVLARLPVRHDSGQRARRRDGRQAHRVVRVLDAKLDVLVIVEKVERELRPAQHFARDNVDGRLIRKACCLAKRILAGPHALALVVPFRASLFGG